MFKYQQRKLNDRALKSVTTPTAELCWRVPSVGIPVRIGFLAGSCFFFWLSSGQILLDKVWSAAMCLFSMASSRFGPTGAVCRAVTNSDDTQHPWGAGLFWNTFSFFLLFICPVAMFLNCAANKGNDRRQLLQKCSSFWLRGAWSHAKQIEKGSTGSAWSTSPEDSSSFEAWRFFQTCIWPQTCS